MNRFAAFRASIVAAAALAISACGINSVPAAEETAKAKWADVEAAFQERANLVPNLEQIVMSSAEQERATLESVIQARASATRPEIQLDGNDLSDADKMAQYQQAQNTFGGALSRLPRSRIRPLGDRRSVADVPAARSHRPQGAGDEHPARCTK